MNDEWDAVTGTFSTVYRLNPDAMVYATVATGFKGGGYNGGFGNTPLARRPFDAEEVIELRDRREDRAAASACA